jgi:hypothetical protein
MSKKLAYCSFKSNIKVYVERIFSICGWLTTGRHNRLTKNLAMCEFMKLNKNLLSVL